MLGTMLVAFIITGSFKVSLMVGGVDVAVKLLFYYIHEIVWEKIIERIKEKKNA
jgi:uncharacterized membrane protein